MRLTKSLHFQTELPAKPVGMSSSFYTLALRRCLMPGIGWFAVGAVREPPLLWPKNTWWLGAFVEAPMFGRGKALCFGLPS